MQIQRSFMEQEITVLIVDDEEEIRGGLRRVIQREHPNLRFLESVANGQDGLQAIREYLPDIVITDINMPEMSGLEMIEKAREEGYTGSFVVLSGYDDFKYAQTAIRNGVDDYLIKPVVIDDLREIMERLEQKIQKRRQQQDNKVKLSQSLHKANRIITEQNFISEFLRRELSGVYLSEAIRKIDPALEAGPVCAIVFYFYKKDILQDDEISQVGLNVWCGCIRRAMAGQHICMGYDGRNSSVVMFCAQPLQNIKEQMRSVADKLYDYYHVRCFVSVGDTVTDFKNISQSYKNAALISTWHIYPQLGKVGDRSLTEKKITYFSIDTMPIIKSIRRGDANAVRQEFEAYTNQLLQSDPTPSPAYLFSMYHFLITEIRTHSEKTLDSYTGDAYQAMRQFDTFEEIYAWLEKVLVDFSYEVSIHHVEMQDPVIEKALEYIKSHICQKISAEDVCRYIGLSKTYFSKYFKEKTDLNFRDYLLDLKIDYAQQKLTENSCTPSELAALLGYEEYSSFSRAFKARTGFSPQDYQKANSGSRF